MMVRIYTMKNCPYCNELKGLFEKENIKYIEVDIDLPDNQEECDKVFEICKVESVPIVKVGKQLLAPEISFTSIKEALTITKRFLNY